MSSNLSDLTQLEKANQDYLSGLELLQTSCIKCRFTPNYIDAIPLFKKAADAYRGSGNFQKEINSREKLAKCYKSEKSAWEEGNEYEKISRIQLNQLKSAPDAYNSVINSFHAYASNRSYDDGIKALTKISNEFIDSGNEEEAVKVLTFAFDEIDRYYHVITLDKEENHHYIYECIDKYIDLLFSKEDYEKSAEVAHKSAEMIKKDQKEEKRLICKYYGFQAIAEICGKKEDKFETTIETGKGFESNGDEFCSNISRFVNVVKQNHKDNERIIKSLFNSLSRKVPASMAKMINIKIIKEYANNTSEIKTDASEEVDLK
jgi:tetratricopeptide (TPR) repeat protein